jgi:hypothetical protein
MPVGPISERGSHFKLQTGRNIALTPNSSIIFRTPNTARHGGLSPYWPTAYFVR